MCAAAVAAEAAAEREATLARSLKTMVVFTERAPVSDATSSVVRRTPRIGLRGDPGMGWKQPRHGDGASALQFFITDGIEKQAPAVKWPWRLHVAPQHWRESEGLGRDRVASGQRHCSIADRAAPALGKQSRQQE